MDPDSIRSAELIGVGGAKPATSRGRSAGVAEFCRFVHWKDPSQKLMDDIKDYPRSNMNKSAGEMIAITFGNVWFKILF